MIFSMTSDESKSRTQQVGLTKSRRFSTTMALLLVFGLYFPTTESQHLSAYLVSAYLVLLTLLSLLIFRKGGHPRIASCLILTSITPLLLVFTATSGLSTLTLGALVGYGALSVCLVTNLRDIGLPAWFGKLWIAVNLVNIIVGFAMVAGVPWVDDFFVAHYSTAYEGLVASMLALHKPVLTFGSHSIAAFFFYLFFWINLQAHKLEGRKLSLVFSVCYLFLTMCLLSVSALVFSAAGWFLLGVHFWSATRHKVLWGMATLGLVAAVAAFWVPTIRWTPVTDAVKQILQDRGNGLSGRFLPGGSMYEDLQYLENHVFLPVGASFREGLMFGDDGPVEYLLRGSAPLLLLVYGGLFYFLRRNMILKVQCYTLFATIVVFELGITTLTSLRTLYLIPVFVVYLNSLAASQTRGSSPSNASAFVRGWAQKSCNRPDLCQPPARCKSL
jgi:hypothetical protein